MTLRIGGGSAYGFCIDLSEIERYSDPNHMCNVHWLMPSSTKFSLCMVRRSLPPAVCCPYRAGYNTTVLTLHPHRLDIRHREPNIKPTSQISTLGLYQPPHLFSSLLSFNAHKIVHLFSHPYTNIESPNPQAHNRSRPRVLTCSTLTIHYLHTPFVHQNKLYVRTPHRRAQRSRPLRLTSHSPWNTHTLRSPPTLSQTHPRCQSSFPKLPQPAFRETEKRTIEFEFLSWKRPFREKWEVGECCILDLTRYNEFEISGWW